MLGVLLKSVTETCDDMMVLFERGKKNKLWLNSLLL